MWTASARHQYRRTGGRYATDVTDAEFALIEPLLPAGQARRAAADDVVARGAERAAVPAAHRLPVAHAAARVPAAEHGLRLFPPLLAGRHLVDDPGHPAHGGAGAGWPRGVADRGDHRQPERQDDRSRRPARLRRRQEGQRPQAAPAHRHAGPAAAAGRPCRPTSRTATAWGWSAPGSDGVSPGCSTCSPMPATRARSPCAPQRASGCGSRSSSARATPTGFHLLPRRWVIERTFAWLGRNRRLAKDFERLIDTTTAMAVLAIIQLLIRRLASP